MARDGEDDGRIMAQSQSITHGRLICSRDGGGGPAFLQGEQTTNEHFAPTPDSPPGLAVIDPGHANPSPELICAVGALVVVLHAEAPSSSSSSKQHRATTQALACAVLRCAVDAAAAAVCLYCPHTVIMRSSLDTASKRARAICHRNLV